LLATIALAIGTTLILKSSKKKIYALVTFLPMLFMLATTVDAGIENIFFNYLPQGTFNGNLNAFLSSVMLILVAVIIIDSFAKWIYYLTHHFRGLALAPTREKEEALELDI
jgi:carbon starvation protein